MNNGKPMIFSKSKHMLYTVLFPSNFEENESNRRHPYSGPILAFRFVSFWHMALVFTKQDTICRIGQISDFLNNLSRLIFY